MLEGLDEIAVVLGVHEGRTGLKRLLGIDDDRNRVVINLHGIGRVAGEVAIVGNHHRHGLADVACELLGQNCLLGVAHVAARVRGAQHAGLNRQRRVGQHGVDARHSQCGRGIDAVDLRVPKRGAYEGSVQHAGQLEVVDVATLARDELAVFLAEYGIADAAAGESFGGRHAQLLAISSAALRTAATMF